MTEKKLYDDSGTKTFKLSDEGVLCPEGSMSVDFMLGLAATWFEVASERGWKVRDDKGIVISPEASWGRLQKAMAGAVT